MNCQVVRGLLSAYIDLELSPDEILEVRNHLFRCDSCSAEHDALLQARSTITGLTRQEPREELLSLIACRPWELESERSAAEAPRRLATNRMKTRWIQAAAAMLCLAVTAGIGLSTSGITRISAPQANLSKSFQAERERFQYASPLAGMPAAVNTGEADVTALPDDSSAEVGTSPSVGLVSFVSHTTVE